MNTLLCSLLYAPSLCPSPHLFQPLQPLSPPKYSNYGDIRGYSPLPLESLYSGMVGSKDSHVR